MFFLVGLALNNFLSYANSNQILCGGAHSYQLVIILESGPLASSCSFFFVNVSLPQSLLLVSLHFLVPWIFGSRILQGMDIVGVW